MDSAELVPFDASNAAAVAGWVGSPEELQAWASLHEPADPSVFRAWHADPDVRPFLLRVGGELAGYGEVWEDRENGEAELARLIVAPDRRGRGIGRALATMLAREALDAGFAQVWLRVQPTNAPALACYRAAGFVRATPEQEADFNRGQPRTYVWMSLGANPG